MAQTGYYVRSRGKISGPYDVSTLQQMTRRGSLSRAHEISTDRMSWDAAGGFAELFPAAVQAESTATVPPSAHAAAAPAGAPPASSPTGGQFYYSQGGSTVGP